MEEEKVEVKNEAKKFDLKSINYKKYLPIAGIALAVLVVIIILVVALGGGPKKAVKKFVSGMNSKNASKVVDSVDFAGMSAWKYYYDENDFSDDDYDEFIENYKDVDKDDVKDAKKEAKENMEEEFDNIKDEYKSYKIKVDEIKSTEKIAKDLYVVKAKISMEAKPKDKDEDEIDEARVFTFIVYKNKLITLGGLGL